MAHNVDPNEILIELIQPHPLLYDRENCDFKDKNKKGKLWKDIASEYLIITSEETSGTNNFNFFRNNKILFLFYDSFIVKFIIKKWDKLKADYMSARREVNEYIPSGSGVSDAHETDFAYYDMMHLFLKNVKLHNDE